MNFTDIFIKRPVLATVISLLILLIGFRSIESLNVRQYPRSDIAVVTITTVYVGASADLIRGFITTPLEREIASADGIDYMESSSGPSVSAITVHLRLNYDPNAALTQITSKVNKVRNQLPADAQDPVIDVQMAESTAAMYLMFSSDVLDSNQITDYLYRVVQPKLNAVSGVQSAQIVGGRIFAMRIWLKPDKLAAYGLSSSQVWQALATNNFLSAVGSTKGSMISVNLNVSTDLHTVDEFRRLVIREQDNAIIHLGDVAGVVLGAEDYESTVKFGGKPTTAIAINVLPTANALTVINDVRKVFPQIVARASARHDRLDSLRRHGLHPERDRRGRQHPGRGPADRHRHHLPVPRHGPLGDHSDRGHAALPGGRVLPHAGDGLYHQPADPAGHGAGHRARGGRRHRRRREHPPAHRGGARRRWRPACRGRANWAGRSSP